MKKLLVLAPLFLLTACMGSNGPDIGLAPAPEMPDLPASLSKKAERLPDLTGKTLAEREQEGIKTDQMYNEKATQLNTLIDVYNCVKKALKEKKSADQCFGDIL